MNLFTLLISFLGIRLVLASPLVARDDHALDDWLNQANGAVGVTDNPNKRPGDACTVVNDEGAGLPGKVSYPRDCTSLSVWKNSFEEDRNARLGDPDSCMHPSFPFLVEVTPCTCLLLF